jgi:hypothetical protein
MAKTEWGHVVTRELTIHLWMTEADPGGRVEHLDTSHSSGNNSCRDVSHVVLEDNKQNNDRKPCRARGVCGCAGIVKCTTTRQRTAEQTLFKYVSASHDLLVVYFLLIYIRCKSQRLPVKSSCGVQILPSVVSKLRALFRKHTIDPTSLHNCCNTGRWFMSEERCMYPRGVSLEL